MGNKNTNLQIAKNVKDDEFYTTYETIEKRSNITLLILKIKWFYVIVMIRMNLISVNFS